VGQPVLLATLTLDRVGHDAAVALRSHRPGADHHRIDSRAEADEHLGVALAADRTRYSVDRCLAVQGEHEVGDDPRPPVYRRIEGP
jgi:hypothetical protein